MTTALFYGMVRGSAYALAALGLVLVFRTSRVVNFAHGAIATVSTFTFIFLRTGQGIDLQAFTLRVTLPTPLALAAALAVAAGLGLLMERTTMRPLQQKGQGPKLVATLGWLLVLQFGNELLFGKKDQIAAPMFPTGGFSVVGVRLQWYEIGLVVVMLALAVLLTLWLTRTRFGASIRAVSQDRGAAQMLGVDANRVTAAAWGVSGLLAGVAGILVAPSTFVEADAFTTLLFKAFAAALIAAFSSFAVAVLAGVALGGLEDLFGYLIDLSFAREALTFALLLAVLVLRSSNAFSGLDDAARSFLARLRPPRQQAPAEVAP